MSTGKLKKQKSTIINQIRAEFIIACCRLIPYDITRPFNFIWNEEKMLEKWKEPIIVPNSSKGDERECSNF
jgi:hypothetical protein